MRTVFPDIRMSTNKARRRVWFPVFNRIDAYLFYKWDKMHSP